MRLLIVGAGATIAEAEPIRSGLSESLPTMENFGINYWKDGKHG